MLAVNVTGTILCCREAVRRLSNRHGGRGGAIVNISSLAARTGGASEWVHYAASKGAVNSYTIGLAREVAAEGIRVNAVAPGLIDTELHAANGAPDRVGRMASSVPMQRGGTPAEVAEGGLAIATPRRGVIAYMPDLKDTRVRRVKRPWTSQTARPSPSQYVALGPPSPAVQERGFRPHRSRMIPHES
jgi:NAD(P)-dependent dehydrogenase (short-subunit alcohol dehydrogenase family)